MGRMEILSGVERRRDWSDDKKLSILDEASLAGGRVVDVARRHDILPKQIYAWRKKFSMKRTGSVVSFVPVALIAPQAPSEAGRSDSVERDAGLKRSARSIRIEIVCKGGRVLKVEAGIAPDVLKALIRSVEEA